MSVAAMVSPGVSKEIRALLPVWALSIAGLGGAFVWGENIPLGLIAYGVGVLALGAQSVGQEYGYRTLPLLLSQPIARRRLLALKAAVLVPMLLTVFAIAGLLFPYAYGPDFSTTRDLAELFLPVLCALLLTPWLTMVCRSALAGVVFSIGLSGAILTMSRVFAGSLGSSSNAGIGAMLVMWALSGVLGWRRFMRLEAVDATAASLHLPRTGRAARMHHPVWMLTLKELHLQQLTFALVAVYLGVWGSLLVAQRVAGVSVPGAAEIPFDVLTPMYLVLLTLLIGALASAEERQLGTMDSQQLLPVAASRQWMVKVAVVFGLTATFAIALPAVLEWIMTVSGGRGKSYRLEVALVAIVSTAGSLYVSSLCRTGMQAAVLSIALVPLALSLYLFLLQKLVRSPFIWNLSRPIAAPSWPFAEEAFTMTLEAFIVTILVRFAYLNHRSAERSAMSVRRQLILVGLAMAGGSVVFAAVLRAVSGG